MDYQSSCCHVVCTDKKADCSMEDGDSGVFNSSKLSAGSLLDDDFTDHLDVRAGAFDYFDNTNSTSETISKFISTSSAEDCCCTRCEEALEKKGQKAIDKDYNGIDHMNFEMKTYKTNQPENEVAVDQNIYIENKTPKNMLLGGIHADDSDNSYEDLESVVVHKTEEWGQFKDAHQTSFKNSTTYSIHKHAERTENSENEFSVKSPGKHTKPVDDVANECDYKKSYTASPSRGSTIAYGCNMFRNRVDATVRFPLNGSTSSESVKIDKTFKKKSELKMSSFINSGNTEDKLQSSSKLTHNDVKSECNFSSKLSTVHKSWIGTESANNIITNKKKQQYKDVSEPDYDENGNPLGCFSTYRSDTLQGNNHLINLELDKCMKGIPSSNSVRQNSQSIGADTKKKRRRKRRDEAIIKPETLPGYIGDKPLDVLLSFIDGNSPSHNNNSCKTSVSNHYQDQKDPPLSTTVNAPNFTEGQQTNYFPTFPKRENKRKKKKGKNSDDNMNVSETENSSLHRETDLVRETFRENSISLDLIKELTSLTKKSKSPSLEQGISIMKHIEHIHPSNSYIFTDFDNKLPKEDQFVLVTKKKKKQIGNCNDFRSLSENSGADISFRRSNLRSYTPPPVTTESGLSQTCERKLSSSLFPVQSNSKESRRNSTGSVSEVACSYKRDTESMKSVLAEEGNIKSDKISSNLLSGMNYQPMAISYASIAARSKTCMSSQDCSGQEEEGEMTIGLIVSSSGDSSKVVPDEPSASALPGNNMSHSACSLPVTVVTSNYALPSSSFAFSQSGQLDSTINTSNNNTTFYMQQNGLCSSVNTVTVDVVQSKSPICHMICETNNSEDYSRSKFTTNMSTANVEDVTNLSASALCQTENTLCPAADSVSENSQLPRIVAMDVRCSHTANTGLGASPGWNLSDSSKPTVVGYLTASSTKLSHDVDKKDLEIEPCVQTKPKPMVKPSKIPKVTSNKGKNLLSKSVIFLDRKIDDDYKNLDISFGFEPDPISDVMSISSTCGSVSGETIEAVVSVPLAQDKLCSTRGSGCDISDLVFLGPELLNQDKECEQVTPKLSPPNGVVLTSVINDKQIDKNVSSTKSDQSLLPSNVSEEQQTKRQRNSIRDYNDVNTNTSDVSSSYKKPNSYIYDKCNDARFEAGNFNHEAGVAFLYSDWLRVQAFATRYGASALKSSERPNCINEHPDMST